MHGKSSVATIVCTVALLWSACLDMATGPGDNNPHPGKVAPTSHRAAEYPSQCSAQQWSDDLVSHVTYPVGGEVFHVGDTVYLGFCDKDTLDPRASRGCVTVGLNGGKYEYRLSEMECGAENPMMWIVPDSVDLVVAEGIRRFSVVGEQCFVRWTEYFQIQSHQSGLFAVRER